MHRTVALLGLLAATPVWPALAENQAPAPETAQAPVSGGVRYLVDVGHEVVVSKSLSPGTVEVTNGRDLITAKLAGSELVVSGLKPGRASVTYVSTGGRRLYFNMTIKAESAEAPPVETTPLTATPVVPPVTTPTIVTETEAKVVPPARVIPIAAQEPAKASPTNSVAVPNEQLTPDGSTILTAAQLTPSLPLPNARTANPPAFRRAMVLAPALQDRSSTARQITVTQGLARLLTFRKNILAVFFSDDNVMDGRAINARTLAITGKAPGRATLAVFTAQSDTDTVGLANIFRIVVEPASPAMPPQPTIDASTAEAAITSALDDPRITVTASQTPRGLTVGLRGAVRYPEERTAAEKTAAFWVEPANIADAITVDPNAPTIDQLRNPTPAAPTQDQVLQSKLREMTGNQTIELIPMPGAMVLKAEVNSIDEAEALQRLIPTLNQKVQPFIVVHGAGGAAAKPYVAPVMPLLSDEDQRMTQVLQSVTQINTIYAVRTAKNGIAVYGTVRDRAEYARTERYALTLPHILEATPTGSGAAGSNQIQQIMPLIGRSTPFSGDMYPPTVQLFVHVMDAEAADARIVTIDTSVVEISRTALKNLGAQFGSVNLTSETLTPASAGTVTTEANGTTIVTGGTPATIQRTIDPTFNHGAATLGNGFVGTGGFGNINPFRVQLNALLNNGKARLLSQPNVTAVEGAIASITVGGARPIPETFTSGGGAGSVQSNLVFRKFGIIFAIRPTVTDDNTIILQLSGNVVQLDSTTGILQNGALVPGEIVRSIDTTVTVREGDTLIMGGLITNEQRTQTSKIPVLSRIPILGALFTSKRFENNETELAMFLTPHITRMKVSDETLANLHAISSLPQLPNVQMETASGTGAAGSGSSGAAPTTGGGGGGH
jgi:Flp pilus assembly secretin CpaC